MIRLFQTWSDLLGDAHGELFKEPESDGSSVSSWDTDDYFYHAQGMAHTIYHLAKAVRREYADRSHQPAERQHSCSTTSSTRSARRR